jgi:WD40 repeat protein
MINPNALFPITPDNIHRLKPLATLGRGEIKAMAWFDDNTLIIATLFALWHFTRNGEVTEVFRFNRETANHESQLTLSEDKKRLLLWDAHKTVFIRDAYTGSLHSTIHLAYAADKTDFRQTINHDHTMYAVANKKNARLFNLQTGQQKFEISLPEIVRHIVFSGDDCYLLAMNAHSMFYIEVQTGVISHVETTPSTHIDQFVTSYRDGKELKRDIQTETLRAVVEISTINLLCNETFLVLRGHEYPIEGIMLNADETTLISVDFIDMVIVWDLKTGQMLASQKGMGNSNVRFSPNGTAIAATNSNYIMIWNRLTGEKWSFSKGHQGIITSLQVNPDGFSLTSGGNDKTCLWNWQTGEFIESVSDGEVSPDGQRTASTVSFYGSRTTVNEIKTNDPILEKAGIALAFSPDSQSLYYTLKGTPSASRTSHRRFLQDTHIFKVNLNTGEEELFLSLAQGDGIWFDPKCCWYVRDAETQGVTVFDVESQHLHCMVYPAHEELSFICFSSDGHLFATVTTSPYIIEIWEIQTGEQVERVHVVEWDIQAKQTRCTFKNSFMFAFNSDGRLLAVDSDGFVKVWDTQDMTCLAKLDTGKNGIEEINFDSKLFAIGNNDGTITLWGVEHDQP